MGNRVKCYIYCEHTVKVLIDALTVKDREIIEHKKSYAERDLSRVFLQKNTAEIYGFF